LIGKAGLVEDGEEEVARPITGEYPARAVASVRRRREADDHDARLWIAEAGNRFRPVTLARIARWRMARRFLAPPDQARAEHALHDLGVDPLQRIRLAVHRTAPDVTPLSRLTN
jgi:hypothetical protein